MRSIAFKLSFAFLLVSLAGIGVTAILAGRLTATEFNSFVGALSQQSVVRQLTQFYEVRGSWQGLQNVLNRQNRGRLREPEPFVLANVQGEVIVGDQNHRPSTRLSRQEVNDSVTIVVDDEVVGYVFSPVLRVTPFLNRFLQQQSKELAENERAFIRSVYRILFVGALVAGILSITLGLLLARSLTRPLKDLTEATHAIAEGDLEQMVPIRSQDEFGELAESFNQMNARLAHARETRQQMTADIAHDLRTPLSIILGHAEALSDSVLPPTHETFDIIHDEAKRLNRLVDDLRTLSLSEAGELPLNRRLYPTQKLLEQVVTSYAQPALKGDIDIKTNFAPDLPEINIDPDRMTQVFDNLLSNALRYTPAGGVITLAARHNNGSVRMAVRDTGAGVSPEELPHIFDRFYRADKSRNRDKGGSGLGLAIARSIVEAHDGTINARSEPGKGLTFVIELAY